MGAGDRTTLIAIFRGTGGEAWRLKTGWCTDVPLSQWHGVSVDDEGRVVGLDLSRNNLVGEIPRELGSLHNLKELKLSGNKLTGEIPRELGSLHDLNWLNLSGNKLTGEIPRELGSLHDLNWLNLSGNKLTGEIPRELGSLHNLNWLNLSGNNLTGEIPRELGSLHILNWLNLSGNKLTGEIPRELGSLHNLNWLNLSGNNLTGRIPRELGSLHNLKELKLSENKLTGGIPRELGSLHNPNWLNLSGNDLTGSVPAQLVKLYRLLRLDLAGNNLSGPLPSSKQLEDLFDALARTDSGNEEPPVYSDTTGPLEKGPTQKAASSASTAVTASMTALSRSGPSAYSGETHLEWEERQGIIEGQQREKLRKVAARVSDFEGDVKAWSFGSTSEVIRCPDFELEVPGLARNVPALIGQSPSEAETIDGEVCLLHRVVTCLASSGEIFNPPLLLRFPVGYAMESGSDVGSSNEDEESYKADLRSRFSAVKREEGSSTWVPIVGEIKKMDNGVFVVETQVSHFTDYALTQALSLPWSVNIGQGEVDKIKDKKLRNVFLFENKGDQTIMLYYWHRRTRRSWTPSFWTTLKVPLVEVGGGVDREMLSNPTDMVYVKLLPSNKAVALYNAKSLEVAWATLEEHDDHRLVTVWGWDTMYHKEAMRIGPLPERVHARVAGLRIADDEDVGNKVRASLENK